MSRDARLRTHGDRRRRLIEHLRAVGVTDLAVLHAFDQVPRHLFVPEIFEARAYADEALPLGHGQTISRPSTHARYLQELGLEGDERVLEIGTGSGFQTALLAALCQQVFSVERLPEMALAARARIEALGITNALVRAGDGSYGWRKYSPYHAIVVAAGAPRAPDALIRQLAPGGRLLIPIGDRRRQDLHRIVKKMDGSIEDETIAQVRFVPLGGEAGDGSVEQQVVEW